MRDTMLMPILVLVAWTLVMWVWMYATRIPAIQRAGLAPERAVFIDDSPKNVEGARAVGMHAIAFTTPSDLREALRGYELPGGVTV